MDLSFIYHSGALSVIVAPFLLDNLSMGVGDDCNNEIHEDHEQKELPYDVDYPSKNHNYLTLLEFALWERRRNAVGPIVQVKAHVRV